MANNMEHDPCIVCRTEQALSIGTGATDQFRQNCPRCGQFIITGTAASIINRGMQEENRTKLSGWVLEQNRSGSTPIIISDNLQSILNRPIPSVSKRADRLLIEAAHNQDSLKIRFNINDPRFLAATYSSTQEDVNFLASALSEKGFIENMTMNGGASISADGVFFIDDIKREYTTSSQGFIAMWFDESLNEIYSKGFQLAVLESGYNPIRIDHVEHINKIDDEIIAQINASKFLVADFTGHRGGVYFEAGYALGLDIPVFWTCRSNEMTNLHFDIRQFNCIDWNTAEELASRLSNRIEAVLGPGPNKAEF